MSTSHHDTVHRLFTEAVRLSLEERPAYLEQACADDADLRAEVEAMLAEDARTDGAFAAVADEGGARFLAGAFVRDGDLEAPAREQPECLGKYRILRVIGEGGMGVVYEAEQENPRRRVALKVIRTSMVTRDLLQRFRHESRVLGHLQHPGIAQIYEAGTADSGQGGQPYFAMELVEGEIITEYADSRGLDTPARLDLLAQLCDILEYAHQKGVIHRDIKPANILVTAELSGTGSSHGQPLLKVLDFGVARATDADLNTVTLQTTMGQLIGTVPYMSPEQASGDPAQIDTRSDVYSVGVLGWELLTGRLPYDVRGKMVHEAVRVIREVEPSRLSAVDRSFRGDVETIFVKALEKDKERRYQSAAEFAADLRHYLAHEPIAARPASTLYQMGKFARRNKTLVGGVAATLVVAIGGGVVATGFALEARRRASNLDQIVAYQSELLTDINVETMGIELRESVLASARSAMQRSSIDQTEIEQRSAQLAELLAGANFTEISRHVLNDNIYADAMTGIDSRLSDQPLLQARLHQSLAETLYALGLYVAAMPPLDRALALRRHHLGDDHPDTLASLVFRGKLLGDVGKWLEAEQIFRDVLEQRRRVLGDAHADTLDSIFSLEYNLYLQGKIEESDALFREYAATQRRLLGDDHPEMVRLTAGRLWREGRFEEAERYYRRLMEEGLRVHGERTLSAALLMSNLANVLANIDRLPEAETLYADAIATIRACCGDTHPHVMMISHILGDTLLRQDKLVEAEAVLAEALATTRLVKGDRSDATATARIALADVLTRMERFDEAEPLLLEAVADGEASFPDTPDAVRQPIEQLVRLYETWQKPDQAAAWMGRLDSLRAGERAAPSGDEDR